MGNAATGAVAGINAARLLTGENPVIFPTQTMLGALCHYVTHAQAKSFQPMKANFGLLSMPEQRMGKKERYHYYSKRALTAMRRFTRERRIEYDSHVAERDLGQGNEAR
jgi:methylenetetrahydrofolate--tRNA-(uracil-5-)-methyltransferase